VLCGAAMMAIGAMMLLILVMTAVVYGPQVFAKAEDHLPVLAKVVTGAIVLAGVIVWTGAAITSVFAGWILICETDGNGDAP
jgi:hypothetical protein